MFMKTLFKFLLVLVILSAVLLTPGCAVEGVVATGAVVYDYPFYVGPSVIFYDSYPYYHHYYGPPRHYYVRPPVHQPPHMTPPPHSVRPQGPMPPREGIRPPTPQPQRGGNPTRPSSRVPQQR